MSHSSEAFLDRFGIIARTYARRNLKETLDAVRDHGIRLIQLNLSTAGLPTLPERFEPGQIESIAKTIKDSGRTIVALSGTFNMIDPDLAKRRGCFKKLDLLAENCRALGTSLITLCSGTRDRHDMWKRHADNDSSEAWSDLVESMTEAARIADRHDITMAFEPELGNVIDTAEKARKLLDTIGSKRIKVVFDAANIIRPEAIPQMASTIDDAFELLAPDIAIIHAKEISATGEAGETAPGKGVLDFARVFRHARAANLNVPIVMHGLAEADIPAAMHHLTNEFAFTESTHVFEHDGIRFRYFDIGSGVPFIFQHGLGGDCKKVFTLTRDYTGIRLISFDARYHGMTEPLGSPEKIGFRQFADDLLAMMNDLKIDKAVIGGLSMGAGIALGFVTRHPDRALGLVMARPAFFKQAFPDHLHVYSEIVELIKVHGLRHGLELFHKTQTYHKLLAESSDAAAATTGVFQDPKALETLEKYARIPRDCPPSDLTILQSIRVPVMILSSHQDPIHPYDTGQDLTSAIPGAEFHELTPKCVSTAAYEDDLNRNISHFLQKRIATSTASLR